MGFFDAMNKSIDVAVPLTMKLHELNRAEAFEREKWGEQQKNLDLARQQLEQSISATRRNLELQEKAQKMKEEGEAYLKGITSGGQPIQTPTYRDSWMPEGVQTPTETTLSKPRTPTMEEIAHALTLRGDPIQAATVLSKEATAESKDKLADVKLKIAEMVQAGKSESDINNFLKALAVANINAGSREKVAGINKEGKVEAAGISAKNKEDSVSDMRDQDYLENKIAEKAKDKEAGQRYVDKYNNRDTSTVILWKEPTNMLGINVGGGWKKKQIPAGTTYHGEPVTGKVLMKIAKENGISVEDALKKIESYAAERGL